MTHALFNGAPVDAASGLEHGRGLHYGDGVFRTVLYWRGELLDWDLHLDKLHADCGLLHLQPPDAASLAGDVGRVLPSQASAIVKILVVRRAAQRGYVPTHADADRLVLAYPAPAVAPQNYRSGIAAMRSPVVLSEQPLLAGVKHLNRLEQVLASRSWREGVMEALTCDAGGDVICGTRSNLFCVVDEELLTPRLDRCGVAGIMRRRVLAAAAQLGLRAREVGLPWERFCASSEAFVCNAVIGIWPLRSCDQRQWGAPGATTRALMQALRHPPSIENP